VDLKNTGLHLASFGFNLAGTAASVASAVGTYTYCINHDYNAVTATGLAFASGVAIFGLWTIAANTKAWNTRLISLTLAAGLTTLSGYTVLEGVKKPLWDNYHANVEVERLRIITANQSRLSIEDNTNNTLLAERTRQLSLNNAQIKTLNKRYEKINGRIAGYEKSVNKGIRPNFHKKAIQSANKKLHGIQDSLEKLNTSNASLLKSLTTKTQDSVNSTVPSKIFEKPQYKKHDYVQAYLMDILTIIFIWMNSVNHALINSRRKKKINTVYQEQEAAAKINEELTSNIEKAHAIYKKNIQHDNQISERNRQAAAFDKTLHALIDQSSISAETLNTVVKISADQYEGLSALLVKQLALVEKINKEREAIHNLAQSTKEAIITAKDNQIKVLKKEQEDLLASLNNQGKTSMKDIAKKGGEIVSKINDANFQQEQQQEKFTRQSAEKLKQVGYQVKQLKNATQAAGKVVQIAQNLQVTADDYGVTGQGQSFISDEVTDDVSDSASDETALTLKVSEIQDKSENNLTFFKERLVPRSDKNLITIDNVKAFYSVSAEKSKTIRIMAYEKGFLEREWSNTGYWNYFYPKNNVQGTQKNSNNGVVALFRGRK